jgi:hypothetical protein
VKLNKHISGVVLNIFDEKDYSFIILEGTEIYLENFALRTGPCIKNINQDIVSFRLSSVGQTIEL